MRVRFGPYVLELESRQLLRGDDIVHLSPKAFDLLSMLVSSKPKALSKSDLQERLWPGTFVVEKNLANLVGEIRQAIGDDPSNPRFIRTVHRFGYAFRDQAPPGEVGRPESRSGEVSFRLKWMNGRATLDEGEHVIGRDPDAEIFLNSAGVSRRHARIVVSESQATIEDLGSKNGTFVGDQRVQGARALADGDIIGVGSVKLTLRIFQTPSSTKTERE
jgi:DNA-binding winged helix-turn-helix (wHTH) protein